ncbi:hypothetical protein ACHAXA_003238 [Cyclostephanos tholiformis]|uniref:Histone deacetylase interacting domain-containing protein n=1 Tax=Cyclostephanos tholiformis TaxID=382380 RepID=A0ABD3SBB4_9STRA
MEDMDQDATGNVVTLGVGSGAGMHPTEAHSESSRSALITQEDVSRPSRTAQQDGEVEENEPDDEVEEFSSAEENTSIKVHNQEYDKNSTELNKGLGFIQDLRPKRKRASTSNRYAPGEGGGLAYKKPKVSNMRATSEPGNTGKDAENAQTPANRGGCNATTHVEKKIRHEEGGDRGSLENATRKRSVPSYRWIGEGTTNDATGSLIEYEALEIDFTNMKTAIWTLQSKFVVRLGDAVTISSGDVPWYDSKQKISVYVPNCEAIPIYNDPDSSGPGLGALDPFIGVVERLWEEMDPPKLGSGPRKRKGKSAKSFKSSTRMMMRTRWFFKKEDLEGIRGSFVVEDAANGGSPEEEFLARMSSRDLVLTDQSDNNAVTAIMGKARVVKRNSGDQSIDEDMADPNGCFVCRYKLALCHSNYHGTDAMAVRLSPWTDDTDAFVAFEKKPKHIVSSDPISTDENGRNLARNVNSPMTQFPPSSLALSPRRVGAEGGAFLGKIRIGDNHQADIPPQLNLQRKTSFRCLANPPSQRISTLVWDPAKDEGNHVDNFLRETNSLLSNHLKAVGLEPFHLTNYIGSLDVEAEAKKPREIDVVSLLTELHECRGDARKAIKRIEDRPERFMTIWSKNDKDLFDASYRIYRESIRMIANSLNSKNCKEVVDYQYRFKYCENFRRFMRKKREKAEEIMATVEDRMLTEKIKEDEKKCRGEYDVDSSTSSEDEGKHSAPTIVSSATALGNVLTAVPGPGGVGPVNNRIRTWFRTGGGGKEAVGANEQRRNIACGILTQVREKVGEDAFDTLAKCIKACCNGNKAFDDALLDVKSTAEDIMKSHPDLLMQFMTFLPKEMRCN